MNNVCDKAENSSFDVFSDKRGIVYRPLDLTPQERLIFDRCCEASEWEPVTRRELVFLTKMGDRDVREAIASIRRKGGRIAMCSGKYGYWYARTERQYDTLRKEYLSRIDTLSKTLRAMDSAVEGQVSWQDIV